MTGITPTGALAKTMMKPSHHLIALALLPLALPDAAAQHPETATAAPPSAIVSGQVQGVFRQAARGLLVEVGHGVSVAHQNLLWADVRIDGADTAITVRLQEGQRIETNALVKVRLAPPARPRTVGIREEPQIVAVVPRVVADPAIAPPPLPAQPRGLFELAIAADARAASRPPGAPRHP